MSLPPPPPPNTYKNRFELLSCKITTTNLQKMAIFEKLLVKNSFFIIEVFFFSSRERIISNICVWLHVCMDIIFMLPICMYKHRGHGHPCLRRGTAKFVLYSTVICIRKKSFLPILVLVSMLKMAAFSGLLMLAVFSLTISAPVDKRLQALNDTLSAIERLVRYYKSTFRELNIDGLFGLRVLEGKSAAGCSLLHLHSCTAAVSALLRCLL